MRITLKEIAARAGVSIATVSHALNKTRYVSPEVAQEIYKIAEETGYFENNIKLKKTTAFRTGRMSVMALVIPNSLSAIYSHLLTYLSEYMKKEGHTLSVYLTNNDFTQEEIILKELMADRRIAGIFLTPLKMNSRVYTKLITSTLPFVCLDQTLHIPGITSVISNNFFSTAQSIDHLIKLGHERIAIFLDAPISDAMAERENGYLGALSHAGITSAQKYIFRFESSTPAKALQQIKETLINRHFTAVFAGGNHLTLYCLKAFEEIGLEYPKDISIIGFGDSDWCSLSHLSLTTLQQDTKKLALTATKALLNQISSPDKPKKTSTQVIPMKLEVKNSTRFLAKGPNGEDLLNPEDIYLIKDEEMLVQKGHFNVVISLHYTGTEWTRLLEKGIRDTLENLNVRVLTVMDAHFDWQIQKKQLEFLLQQQPDAVVAVPTDEEMMHDIFKRVSQSSKLILINNIPVGFKEKDYNSWISVNELENGGNAAHILGRHFQGRKAKIGLITHGASFFATRQRDYYAKQILLQHYPNLEIVSEKGFIKEEKVYNLCRQMIQKHPDINGLYVSWDRPALQAIKALKKLDRSDIVLSTTDLDYEIASYLMHNDIVIGLSSQRPYEQGIAAGIATARSLIHPASHSCVGVSPLTVSTGNIEKIWTSILKTKVPTFN